MGPGEHERIGSYDANFTLKAAKPNLIHPFRIQVVQSVEVQDLELVGESEIIPIGGYSIRDLRAAGAIIGKRFYHPVFLSHLCDPMVRQYSHDGLQCIGERRESSTQPQTL